MSFEYSPDLDSEGDDDRGQFLAGDTTMPPHGPFSTTVCYPHTLPQSLIGFGSWTGSSEHRSGGFLNQVGPRSDPLELEDHSSAITGNEYNSAGYRSTASTGIAPESPIPLPESRDMVVAVLAPLPSYCESSNRVGIQRSYPAQDTLGLEAPDSIFRSPYGTYPGYYTQSSIPSSHPMTSSSPIYDSTAWLGSGMQQSVQGSGYQSTIEVPINMAQHCLYSGQYYSPGTSGLTTPRSHGSSSGAQNQSSPASSVTPASPQNQLTNMVGNLSIASFLNIAQVDQGEPSASLDETQSTQECDFDAAQEAPEFVRRMYTLQNKTAMQVYAILKQDHGYKRS